MRLTIPPLHERIKNSEEPFEEDVFGRKDFADNLTRLFRNCDDGLVVTVDAEWGTGKTTLVKLWEMQLEKDEGFIPIYYDAFKNDFTSDAFMSIAVLIHKTLGEVYEKAGKDLKNEKQFEYLKSSLKNLAKGLVKTSVVAGVGTLTGGVVDSKGLIELSKKAMENLAFGTLELDVDEKFKAHTESMKLIEEYQEALNNILKTIGGDSQKKIIFFVDELDRCRPDFAIQVIEKIKHLFSIDNIHFVLAVNKSQLLHTISSAYGVSHNDASTYLQKFVHLETKLPKVDEIKPEENTLDKHFEQLISQFSFSSYILDKGQKDALVTLLSDAHLGMNLREIERLFGLVSIYVMTLDESEEGELGLMIPFALSAIKIKSLLAYNKLKSRRDLTLAPDNTNLENTIYNWIKKSIGLHDDLKLSNTKGVSIAGYSVYPILDIYDFPPEPKSEVEPKQEEKAESPQKDISQDSQASFEGDDPYLNVSEHARRRAKGKLY